MNDSPEEFKVLQRGKQEMEANISEKNRWEEAVIKECMRIEGCLDNNSPEKTLQCIIDWHIENYLDFILYGSKYE